MKSKIELFCEKYGIELNGHLNLHQINWNGKSVVDKNCLTVISLLRTARFARAESALCEAMVVRLA